MSYLHSNRFVLKNFFFSAAFFLMAFSGFSQSALTVKVVDVQKAPLPGVAIILKSLPDSALAAQGYTDTEGQFFQRNLQPGNYLIEAQLVGFEKGQQTITLQERMNRLPDWTLQESRALLKEATVTELQERATQKDDTTEFNAAAFKVNPDADASDLIKKMPGIEVQGGTVQAQGEAVKRVLVDGKEFFGNDPSLALKSLPADVIDKIQVFDRMSEQSQFTGFNDGNTEKTINITTKPGMNKGQFGKIYAGYGTDDRYKAGGNVNIFKGKRRLSFIGMTNNTNEQNFSTQDILQMTGGGGSPFGGRGGRPGFGGGADNFMTGNQNGINQTHSFGVNYSDEFWKGKLKVTGSYFFNQTNNQTDLRLNRQFLLETLPARFYDEIQNNTATNRNHRLNLRITADLDSMNKIILRPNLSFQDNRSNSSFTGSNFSEALKLINSTQTENFSDFSGYQFSNSLLWQRKLNKKGRTISTDLQTELNDRAGSATLFARNRFVTGADSLYVIDQSQESQITAQKLAVNVRYTEQITEKDQLEFNYEPAYQTNYSVQFTDRVDQLTGLPFRDAILSSDFDNFTTTHVAGISYQRSEKKMQFMISANYQNLRLEGDLRTPFETRIDRTWNKILPRAWFRYSFSKTKQFRTFYRARAITPSVQQLQEAVNNSNPLQLSTGNPNLDQGVNHFWVGRFNNINTVTNRNFFMFFNTQITTNYIGNSTFISPIDSILPNGITLPRGAQINRPENLGTSYSFRTYASYGFPLSFIKSNMSLNGGMSWQQSPGLINGARNISDFTNFNTGLTLGSNISEKIDFTLSYSAQYNILENSIQQNLNNNFFTHTAGISGQFAIYKGLIIQSDINQYMYAGLGEAFDLNFLLWNAGIGYKFLKNDAAELRLTVFDLLKQNNSIMRTVNETFVEDRQTTVLQRFFMLTFTYNLRNFKNGKAPEVQENNPYGFPPGMMPPPHLRR